VTYPPHEHVLRDIRISTERIAQDHGLCIVPVTDHIRNAAGNAGIGVIVACADIAGSIAAIAAATPDWTATIDLSLHAVGPIVDGPILAESRLVRAGSNIIVIRLDVFDGRGGDDPAHGTLALAGLVSFARLPRHASELADDSRRRLIGVRSTMARDDTHLREPLAGRLGLSIVDAARGVVELAKTDYVRNSLGTINGGVHGMLYQAAAEAAVDGMVATDMSIHYLAQAKIGPARTSLRILRSAADHAVCEAHAVDAGDGDKLISHAMITLQRINANGG